MRMRATAVLFPLLLLAPGAAGQDFIMQGCYWNCPEDGPRAPIDSASLRFWLERMESQAPELAYAGFSFLWLPALQPNSPAELGQLLDNLEKNGIRPIAELEVGPDSLSLPQQAQRLGRQFQVEAYSLHSRRSLNAASVAQELNQLYRQGKLPKLLVANLPFYGEPDKLGNWAGDVIRNLSAEARPEIDPRVYDYPLREAIRRACTDTSYDARLIFERSIRDATAISGFNVITLVNHPFFKNQNGKTGDWDDPIDNPMPGYAYILTNNQLGLPTVYYGDYYGEESELDNYFHKKPLREQIGQLIRAHKEYIYGSTGVEYLNRFDTDKASHYLSASKGADATRALVFQIDGTTTPAGQRNQPPGHKDVIAAINFADDTLRLIQEINLSNIRPGDEFTDLLGESLSPKMKVVARHPQYGISNCVYIVLPPRSYSLWVQGSAPQIVSSRINLAVDAFTDYVELNWDVAYERKILGYELERSVNGRQFERLASFQPLDKGDEGASYLFIDKDVFPQEQLFYRVKLLDDEGGYEYSAVEKTRLKNRELTFELLEGPRRGGKAVRVMSNFEARAELSVFDAKGKQVLHQKPYIRKGETLAPVDLSGLPAGVYMLHFSTPQGKEWIKKMVKQ